MRKSKSLVKVGRPVIHGIYSPKTIIPYANSVERRIYRQIYQDNLHLTANDRIMVQGLAVHLAQVHQFDKYLEGQGFFDSEGRFRDPLRVYYTCWKNIIKFCSELSLTTASQVRLGILADQYKKTDLAKELEG